MRRSRTTLIALVLLAATSIAGSARAGDSPNEIPMPYKTIGQPAIDLPDYSAADLSTVDPIPNDTWQPVSLPVSNAEKFQYPADYSQVHFLNDIEPNGMYRGQVEYNGRPFRLIVDMDSHQALMNAALLRRMGYPVDMPKHYEHLSIRFDTAEQMKNFVENFAFETEFSRDRWLTRVDEKNLVVSLQDVNLEYPRIDVPQFYNGKINTAWVAGHRAMRGLIIPLMLLDVRLSENSVNIFPWEFARIFAENIMLSHGYVSAFKETTYEDARWAARKIARLSSEELKVIIDQGGYPEDIATLLHDKIIARRNHMVLVFKLENELPKKLIKLDYSSRRSVGKVVKGEATQEHYANHAERFTVGDPASPLRWSELRHYVRMEVLAQGIHALTDKINKELQLKTAKDGIEAHKQDFLNQITNHFKDHPNEPYIVPLKPWVQPLYGLNMNASRSLVTGTFYGSESKAQLVDNLTVGASLGGFGGMDGRTYLQNFGISGSVSYQRTYTHVRPIASLEAVKNESWARLAVPAFMKSTSRILKWKALNRRFIAFKAAYAEAQQRWLKEYPKKWPEYQSALKAFEAAKAKHCESRGYQKPYTDCTPTDAFYLFNIPPFDPTPNVKKIYEKEIGSALASGREIPDLSTDPESPSELPEDLEDTVVLGTLKTFLDDIRDNEVFTITDSFINQITPQVQIPLTTLAGMGVVDLVGQALYGKISPSVGVSMTGQWTIAKRLMFMRKGDQFTVYDTKMNTRALGASANFTAWTELAKVSASRKRGNADTDALMLDLSSITDDDKVKDDSLALDRKKLLMVLSDLFGKNEIDRAKEIAPPYAIHHDTRGKQRNAKVLAWNWTNYAETHRVRLTPPADPNHPFDPKKHAVTLYSARKMNLSGKNPYGIMGQTLSKVVGVNGLLDPGTNQNPSSSFLGSANWSQVRAESDVTDGHDFKPTMILEDYYSGWFLKKDKLMKILDAIQAKVNALNAGIPIFRRDMFESTTQLQAYEIRSSIVLYPSAVQKVEDLLLKARTRQELLLILLDWTSEDDYRKRCRAYFSDRKIETELEQFEKIEEPKRVWNRCIQPWMRKVMRHVRKAPSKKEKEKFTEWLSTTMYIVNKHLDVSRFLNRVGKENFFFQVRVSGFRKGDENATNKNGETDYVTDTIGTIQNPISLGPFRDLKVFTHGVEWQVSDYELQARYFGEGL